MGDDPLGLARELLTARWTADEQRGDESDAILVEAMRRATVSPEVAVPVIERLCRLTLTATFLWEGELKRAGVEVPGNNALALLFRMVERLRQEGGE